MGFLEERRISRSAEAGSDIQDIVADVELSPPNNHVKCRLGRSRTISYVCKSFPLVLHSVRFSLPLLAYDLGNLWVSKSRMMGYDGLLMVLPIKDERYKESATVNKLHHSVKQRNLLSRTRSAP